MNHNEVFLVDLRAHFDSEILAVAEVPSRSMASDDLLRLLDDSFLGIAHGTAWQAHRHVELVGQFEQLLRVVAQRLHLLGDVNHRGALEGLDAIVKVNPILRLSNSKSYSLSTLEVATNHSPTCCPISVRE